MPDQLWHELQVCADAAGRQGIAVDLAAPAGLIPTLPVDVRRALTEPIIAVLAATATKARITVVASPGEVQAVMNAGPQDRGSSSPGVPSRPAGRRCGGFSMITGCYPRITR